MKKISIITILVMLGLVLGFNVVNANIHDYNRTPTGFSIVSPVNFSVSIDSYNDLNCVNPMYKYWNITITSIEHEGETIDYFTTPISSTSLDFNDSVDLPIDSYINVFTACCVNETPEMCGGNQTHLEFNNNEVIFSVGSGLPIYASISADSVANIMGYSSELLGDVGPAAAMVVGIPISFWVIWQVINIIRRRKGL